MDPWKRRTQVSSRILLSFIVLAVGWTSMALWLLDREVRLQESHWVEQAEAEARTSIEKDISFRKWAASHGGVYVPVDEKTPPNPYLSHIPERDITTPSGRRLTLMNPAYIIRQLSDGFAHIEGARTHITSLKPIRPENAADEWEKRALRAFERGEEQVASIVRMDGEEKMRVMVPFITEEGCLKCHARQGYKVGDIRGGISTAIPMKKYRQRIAHLVAEQRTVVAGLWGIGVVGLLGTGSLLSFIWRKRKSAEDELGLANAELDAQNRDLEAMVVDQSVHLSETADELETLAYSITADLRAPLRGIKGMAQALDEDVGGTLAGDDRAFLGRIVSETERMEARIEALSAYHELSSTPLTPEPLDMTSLARVAFNDIVQPQDHRHRLEARPTHKALVDASLVRRLFTLLLENAIKFSDGDSVIRFYSEELEGKEWYVIEDSGVGFEQEYTSKLFHLFQRLHADDRYPGLGTGLAMAHRIVMRHRGRIRIESAPDRGTKVRFTLPAA